MTTIVPILAGISLLPPSSLPCQQHGRRVCVVGRVECEVLVTWSHSAPCMADMVEVWGVVVWAWSGGRGRVGVVWWRVGWAWLVAWLVGVGRVGVSWWACVWAGRGGRVVVGVVCGVVGWRGQVVGVGVAVAGHGWEVKQHGCVA